MLTETDKGSFTFDTDSLRDRCLPPADGKSQVFYWDSILKGLGVCVGATGKRSWVVKGEMPDGRQKRVVIGVYASEANRRAGLKTLTIVEARKLAGQVKADIQRGDDPVARKHARAEASEPKPWETITLAEAMALKVAALKVMRDEKRKQKAEALGVTQKESPNESHRKLETRLNQYAKHLMERRLLDITVADCIDLYEKVSAQGKRPTAKKVLKHIREVWNAVRGRYIDADGNHEMPESPIDRMDGATGKRLSIDSITRVTQPIDDLPKWYSKVQAIKNPVRRDLRLFALFTGHRISECKVARWDDLRRGNILHVYIQKNGEHADVPLSEYVVKLLEARKVENAERFKKYGGDGGWVFPRGLKRAGKVAHIAVETEQTLTGRHSCHRCRDTFLTVGGEVGVSESVLDAIVPHKPSSRNVTRGYQKPSMDSLREAVEKVSLALQRKIGIAAPEVAKVDFTAALVEQNAKLSAQVQQLLEQLQRQNQGPVKLVS